MQISSVVTAQTVCCAAGFFSDPHQRELNLKWRAQSPNTTEIPDVMRHLRIIPLCLLVVSVFATTPLQAELINIDNKALQELLDQGVPIVDVRRADEWTDTGVVEGSHLLTFFDDKGRYDAKQWLSELDKNVDTDKPVIIICQVGGRTSIIGKWLGKQLGTVYNVEEGIVGWKKESGETVAP